MRALCARRRQQPDHVKRVFATGDCLEKAARKLDDGTSDPAVIAQKINMACKKEWDAQGPASDPELRGKGVAEFETKRDQLRQEACGTTVPGLRFQLLLGSGGLQCRNSDA